MIRLNGTSIRLNFYEFVLYLLRELTDIWNFAYSLAAGALITVFLDRLTLTPFFVILPAQAFVQAWRKFHNRDVNTLLQLPAERDDPAFIMDRRGRILLSAGKTKDFFCAHRITRLDHFFGSEGLANLLENVATARGAPAGGNVGVYAEITGKWYEVRAKPAALLCGARIIETMMKYAAREDPRLVMARNIALHHHQTFNGRGYPALRPGEQGRGSLADDDGFYLNCGKSPGGTAGA